MTMKKENDLKVPLFLIAAAISGVVKKRGGKLFRVSVVRTAKHQYLIKYKCRAGDDSHIRAYVNLSPTAMERPSTNEVMDHV